MSGIEPESSSKFPPGAEYLRGRIIGAGREPSGITPEENRQYWRTHSLWNQAWMTVKTHPQITADELGRSLARIGNQTEKY